MSTNIAPQLEVVVNQPGRLYELLDDAEASLRQIPQQLAGILVTRQHARRYTLALTDAVPFGETREYTLS